MLAGGDHKTRDASAASLRDRPLRISAVAFDFDGTLTRPEAIDFVAIHRAVGCPRGMGLLEFLAAVEDPEARKRKETVLVTAEMQAAANCESNKGARELVALLREAGIPMAIITRNLREAVDRAFLNLEGIDPEDFRCVITRDLPLCPKPSPEAVVHVARELGVAVEELMLIGDHAFDMEAGISAGALTMFLKNHLDKSHMIETVDSDFVVEDLVEAAEVIRCGVSLKRT